MVVVRHLIDGDAQIASGRCVIRQLMDGEGRRLIREVERVTRIELA
jgi:hypothetical protein